MSANNYNFSSKYQESQIQFLLENVTFNDVYQGQSLTHLRHWVIINSTLPHPVPTVLNASIHFRNTPKEPGANDRTATPSTVLLLFVIFVLLLPSFRFQLSLTYIFLCSDVIPLILHLFSSAPCFLFTFANPTSFCLFFIVLYFYTDTIILLDCWKTLIFFFTASYYPLSPIYCCHFWLLHALCKIPFIISFKLFPGAF
jgi:hypothetical protein